VISDFKASAEVTEVWPKLETFMGHSLTDLKSMAEVILGNQEVMVKFILAIIFVIIYIINKNFQNAISQSIWHKKFMKLLLKYLS
jgi:hypothetical protein